TTYFYTEEGIVKAVEGVSFQINQGETLGLVGETGCGKSVTALSILQLVRPPGVIERGKVIFRGEIDKNMTPTIQTSIRNFIYNPLNCLL
ncbi:unnamed protein product, partial [marine sediment metagenome]